MDARGREGLIVKVEGQRGKRGKVLRDLKIPRSTYYAWRKDYKAEGIEGLSKAKPSARRIWNRLTAQEESRVLEIARLHPELSPRLLSVKITDEEDFSISESTVYRTLREHALIAPRPLPELRIPEQTEPPFRRKPNPESGASRTPILGLTEPLGAAVRTATMPEQTSLLT